MVGIKKKTGKKRKEKSERKVSSKYVKVESKGRKHNRRKGYQRKTEVEEEK